VDTGPAVTRIILFTLALSSLLLTSLTLCAVPAAADRTHRVRAGQSLARVAARYRVSVQNLAAANDLERTASLRPGQVLTIPEAGVIYVRRGQTLSHVARENDVSVAALRRANRLRAGATLSVGQRLVLPGQESAVEREEAARRWGRPRNPGVAKLYRPATREHLRLRLVDRRGRSRRAAVRRLSTLLRHRRTGQTLEPDRRLIELVSRVSDHFGGRQLNILSGFRPAGGYTRESSRHTRGEAVDLRVTGVPNTVLRDYCMTFSSVGVGYYPRSTFVHLDVRTRSASWTDWSRPGQAPQYSRPARGEEAEGAEGAEGSSSEEAEEAEPEETEPDEAEPEEAAPEEAEPES